MSCKMYVAAVAALGVAGAANAAFTGVTVVESSLVTGFTTYQLFANFDDPTENLLAVSANADFQPFSLEITGGSIYNDGGGIAGLGFEDFANPAAGPGDSYVTIGGNDGEFSPGFLGNAGLGGPAVITGSSLFQADNGGFFDNDPTSAEAGGSVLFAQITIEDTATGLMTGTVDYNQSGGAGPTSNGFTAVLPAPGAIALLGLAGLTGTRRRRG